MAAAGQGVLLGRRPLVDALLARGELVTPFPEGLVSTRGCAVLLAPGAEARPGERPLRDWPLTPA